MYVEKQPFKTIVVPHLVCEVVHTNVNAFTKIGRKDNKEVHQQKTIPTTQVPPEVPLNVFCVTPRSAGGDVPKHKSHRNVIHRLIHKLHP